MLRDELSPIGKVVKTFGVQGELLCKIENIYIKLLNKAESVFLEKSGNLVPFFIESVIERGAENIVFKFEDIDSVDLAAYWIDATLLLPSLHPGRRKTGNTIDHTLIGFTVIDETHGELGIIASIIPIKEQLILSLEVQGTEVLIPVNEETILNIEGNKKIVHTSIPEGLLEIYLGEDNS
jgi:16S rRNA processing protein RimM